MTKDEIKALQAELKVRGLYTGDVDGVMGEGTAKAKQALDKLNADETARQEAARAAAAAAEAANKNTETRTGIDLLNAQTAAKAAEANTKATEAATAETLAKAARKQRYDEDANSALGMGTKVAAGPVALMGGKALGLGLGAGMNAYMNEGQRKRNETLVRAAEDRVKGLTTRDGAIAGTKLAGAMPLGSSASRAASRMAPHVGLGALALATGGELLGDVDPEQPFYPRMADRAFGLANIGAGTGLITQGIKQAAQPGVSPDAAALSIINSNQLRRNNQALPDDAEPKLTPRQALVAEAKAAGITKGVGKMNMTTLAEKLVEARKAAPAALTKLPSLAGPGLAAALAYGMSPDRAEAATPGGAPVSSTAEALTNAAGAGATAYGVNRLARALPAVAGRALGSGLGATAIPTTADAATDFQPGEMNAARNFAARNLPEAVTNTMPATRDAREMAQVPAPSPVPRTERLQNAAALQIPSNIPPNAARDAEMAAQAQQGQPPAGGGMPDMPTQIQILQQHGATPAMIRDYVAHMSAGQ